MGQFFADVHAMPDSQLGGGPCSVNDTEEIAALRSKEDYESLMQLAQALSFQLRYREATAVYSRAIAMEPDATKAYRLRAARYINSLQPAKAMEDFLYCREHGGDVVDLSYRIGLCLYFMGRYQWAMEEFRICFAHSDDEMGIAAIYWHTLSAWRCGEDASLLKKYHSNMNVGHHTGYEKAVALAAGATTLDEFYQVLTAEKEDLEFSIVAYGGYGYLAYIGKTDAAQELLSEVVCRDSFWISYAYIAAWNDYHKSEV
jgi:tetratricopeptide (TPR) repeat protein